MTSSQFPEDVLRPPHHPLPPGTALRLYSMPTCPYAQRARLILAAKKIRYDLVNVDLNNKPDWFFDINFYGEVPVLIHEGKSIYESLICAEYLEEKFPNPALYSMDPYQRSVERNYFNYWTKKGIPAFYGLLKAGCLDPELSSRLDQHMAKMDEFLLVAGTPYYGGQRPGFADYMVWPWFERVPMLGEITGYKVPAARFPLLTDWVTAMGEDPVVQECRTDTRLYVHFYAKYRTGRPDFTLGTTAPAQGDATEGLENLDGLRDPTTRDRQAT